MSEEFVVKNKCFEKQPCGTSVQRTGESFLIRRLFLTNNIYTQEHYM